MGCGGSKDQGQPIAPHPAGSRSSSGQRPSRRDQHVPNPPPPPPPPPASRIPPRTRQNRGQSDIQGIELRPVGHPSQSRVGGQESARPNRKDVLETVGAVANCLNNTNVKYAIVGGAGLVALGAGRVTDDVDFVVYPSTQVKAAKNELRKDSRFSIDPKTRHTKFTTSSGCIVEIEALSYPGTFKDVSTNQRN